MTRDEIINLVKNIFGTCAIKTVSYTDVNKSAYVPNMQQKEIFEFFNINPLDRRNNIEIKELFSNHLLTISYYSSEREGSGRTAEIRMGLKDLISYISIGDELLFTHDSHDIFIYNLSKDTRYEIEDNVLRQVYINLLKNKASNINTRPHQVEQTVHTYPRNNILKNYVKNRSKYSCEMLGCNYEAFTKEDGEKYIEIHHVLPLSEEGEDNIFNTVALCPNCHRELHYAHNRFELRKILVNYLNAVNALGTLN